MVYDYIIIGSGAGGCAAAYRLTLAGKRVLLVEKGGALPTDGSTLDFNQVIKKGAFKARETWLDRKGRQFAPEEYFNLGGKTKWYGAALLRYCREEFEADPEFQCLAWPFSYEELEPYYAEAEKLLGVRSFEIEPDLRMIQERLDRKGWCSEPLPLALSPDILGDEHEARHFDGFASAGGLKAEAQSAFLSRVEELGNLTILTGQAVRELFWSDGASNRIAGVMLADGRALFGRKVLLAAGALLVAALPRCRRPRRPALCPAGRPLFQAPYTHRRAGRFAGPQNRCPPQDHHLVQRQVSPQQHPAPGVRRRRPGFIAAGPRAALARRFGERAYGFFLQTEDGSHERNRVVAEGATLPRLDYDPKRLPAAAGEHRKMVRGFRRVLLSAGYLNLAKSIPLAGTAHACGTLVTGRDPARSVVNPFGKVHGLENLYVVDGSVLPRMSRVNPSLTIYAWALRVADHLIHGRQNHD